jgi:hypothetical protein
MSQEQRKITVVKRENRAKMPCKQDAREEVKRLADLLLTISKRVRQLDDMLKTQ